ncbi:hypothetical protein CEXT_477721 [Caerostris extrusa]|uniref:Uncharacterized protein n=1 Tax=Caerostris extrusa TaxID=172846 RepID=A0AAV4NSA0_CAEEX|nr:hypothetical protein CEXT_477721 [Caerostris extrusa]
MADLGSREPHASLQKPLPLSFPSTSGLVPITPPVVPGSSSFFLQLIPVTGPHLKATPNQNGLFHKGCESVTFGTNSKTRTPFVKVIIRQIDPLRFPQCFFASSSSAGLLLSLITRRDGERSKDSLPPPPTPSPKSAPRHR